MRYRQLDSNGDYVVGVPFLVDSPQCVAQAISTRLKLWQGEWFLDSSAGTPWLQKILGKSTNPDAYVRQAILATPGVLSLTSFSGEFAGSTRVLTIDGTVESLFGQAELSTSINLSVQ